MTEPPSNVLPYAQDAATRVGHTPIGIIMFAASHLLLGAALMLTAAIINSRLPSYSPTLTREMLVPLMIVVGATPMLIGGVSLLLKGPKPWLGAIVSFTLVAAAECAVVAHALGMSVRYFRQRNPDAVWAVTYFLFAFLLTLLGNVVLRYLGRSKARITFRLPPGEAPSLVRWLPRIMLCGMAAALVAGPMLAGVDVLFPD